MKRLIAMALALTVLACADQPTSLDDPGEISVSIVSGDGQTGPAHTELPEALVVRAKQNGNPWDSKVVNFVVTKGGGSVFAGAASTDNQGFAREFWTLGDAGPQELQVRAVGSQTGEKLVFATFTATAIVPPTPSFVQCLSGDGTWQFNGSCGWPAQVAGSVFQVTFRVLDADGVRVVAGVQMTFEVDPTCLGLCDNPGSVVPTSAVTDADGQVTVDWTLGPNAGSNRLLAGILNGNVGVWMTGN